MSVFLLKLRIKIIIIILQGIYYRCTWIAMKCLVIHYIVFKFKDKLPNRPEKKIIEALRDM